jgi:hypothetical protein
LITNPSTIGSEPEQQTFERILSQEPYQGLKAILHKIVSDQEALWKAIKQASTYEELLGQLGYKLTLTKQIHVQDCYSRMGQPGGIKAVLPYHDIPSYSSFPTLINFDRTVTATAKGAAFFNAMFADLKRQLSTLA